MADENKPIDFSPNLLPDTRPKSPKNVQYHLGMNWTPIFCANCGGDGGFVPEENCNFAFYLCQPCAEKLPPIDGTYLVPDELFWRKLQDAQMENFGRIFDGSEIVVELDNPKSVFSKLAKEKR